MLVAFLPGVFFSGFIFEIASMPWPLRAFSRVVPARYYVQGLQTIFLAGDLGSVLWPATGALTLMAILLFLRTAFAAKTRLD